MSVECKLHDVWFSKLSPLEIVKKTKIQSRHEDPSEWSFALWKPIPSVVTVALISYHGYCVYLRNPSASCSVPQSTPAKQSLCWKRVFCTLDLTRRDPEHFCTSFKILSNLDDLCQGKPSRARRINFPSLANFITVDLNAPDFLTFHSWYDEDTFHLFPVFIIYVINFLSTQLIIPQ